MTQTIDIDSFAARHADGAYVIDVREPAEYQAGHVPGAKLTPMSRIWAYSADLPRDVPVYVICQSGNRSRSMADVLAAQGVQSVSVVGGTSAWAGSGRAVITGPRES